MGGVELQPRNTSTRGLVICTIITVNFRGPGSSMGIVIGYGLNGPGIESRWGARFSAPVQTGPGIHPATYTMGTGSFPGVKRPGRGDDHSPQLIATRSTGWTVRGWNPGREGEILRTRPDRPWGQPSHLYDGYRVFPGGKAAKALC